MENLYLLWFTKPLLDWSYLEFSILRKKTESLDKEVLQKNKKVASTKIVLEQFYLRNYVLQEVLKICIDLDRPNIL